MFVPGLSWQKFIFTFKTAAQKEPFVLPCGGAVDSNSCEDAEWVPDRAGVARDDTRARDVPGCLQENAARFFECCFPHGCPEPVLVK